MSKRVSEVQDCDMTYVLEVLEEVLHFYGMECNCNRDPDCEGTCTRARVELAIKFLKDEDQS